MAFCVSSNVVPCIRAPVLNRRSKFTSSNARAMPALSPVAHRSQHRKALLSASAADVGQQTSPEQSQMSVELMKSMEASISQALHAEKVSVQDAYGDGRHVSIEVVSADFEGQTSVKRQRLVYKAIWQELQDTVHAVDSMVTKTPAEIAS